MSVHGIKETGYTVRWREAGRNRSRKFDRKRDAEAFDAKVRQARQRGEPVVSSTVTLNEFVAEWAPRKARNLEAKTANWYARLYDDHVEPYLGELRLDQLRPSVLTRLARWASGGGGGSLRHRPRRSAALADSRRRGLEGADRN